jgi:hypothetical protein
LKDRMNGRYPEVPFGHLRLFTLVPFGT